MDLRYQSSQSDEFSDVLRSHVKNLVTICGSIKASLIVFAAFPVAVKTSQPFVNFNIVKSNIGNNFLFEGTLVSGIIDTVFQSKGFEFSISIKTVLNRLRNLVSEGLDLIDNFNNITNSTFGSLVQNLPDENNNFTSSSLINAGDDGSWVLELVFFEQSIQSLLEDFFVGQSWEAKQLLDLFDGTSQELGHFQDIMGIGSSIKSSLIIFASFPFIIKSLHPFVDSEIMESNVGDNFFLQSTSVGVVVNTIFKTKSFELFVAIQAVFGGLGNFITEFFNIINQADNITD